MQRQQLMGGPHKVHAAPAGQFAVGLKLVLHHLGNRQLGQRLIQRFLQAFGQVRAFGHAVVKQCLGLAIRGTFERCHSRGWVAHIGAQGLQFLEQCGGRVATGV